METQKSKKTDSNEKSELTAIEACQQLGVGLDYLYRLLYAKRLPARKVQGTWRVSAAAVIERARRKDLRNAD